MRSSNGPLEVVFRAPVGDVDAADSITVVVNKPLRRLGEADVVEHPPIAIHPATEGKWRMIGASTLRFEPAKPFLRATRYDVEVQDKPFSPSAEKLEAPYHFTFSTARPTLLGTEPERGASSVRPDASITLYFSAPVSEKEILRAVKLEARGALAFTIAEVDGGRVVLKPKAALPRQTDVRVRIDASLRSEEGELPIGKEESFSFHTIEPLAVEALSCAEIAERPGYCNPAVGSLSLRVSTPLESGALERVVSIKPMPEWFSINGNSDEEGNSRAFEIAGDYQPGQTYTVEIATQHAGRPLLDVFGQQLVSREKRTFRFGDLPSQVQFGASGIYWMPGKRVLPFSMLNADETTISIAPLTKDQALARLAGLDIALSPGKTTQPFPRYEPNKTKWSAITVKDLLPSPETSGPVLVTASYRSGGKNATTSRELQLTDLGMFTKVAYDKALVWVSGLSTGNVVKGAHVEVYHVAEKARPLALGAGDTNEMGLAAIAMQVPSSKEKTKDDSHLMLVAKSGNDWAYQTLRPPSKPAPIGEIFTERGIYRPGETAHVKGVLRVPTTTSLMTPSGEVVTIRLLDPEGKTKQSWRQTLTRYGTFSLPIEIPAGSPIGLYQVEAELFGSVRRTRISVDEYTPVESRISVGVDKAEHAQGERLLCTARGQWLYGGPMVGAKVSLVARRSPTKPSFPNLEGHYAIGDHDLPWSSMQIAQAAGRLDERGSFTLAIPLVLPGQTEAESVTCETEIRAPGAEPQVDTAESIVHSTDFYLALKQDSVYSIEAGEAHDIAVLALSPDGARRKEKVRVEVIRRIHGEGIAVSDQVFATCDVMTGDTPQGCKVRMPLVEPTSAEEIVVRAVATDAKQRRVASSYALGFHAAPTPVTPSKPEPAPAPQPPAPREERVDPAEFSMKTESDFKVGEEVSLSFTSPFPTPTPMLITVYRDGFLFEKVLPLKPKGEITQWRFPVTAAMIPNAIVEATLLSEERSASQRAELTVDASSYALDVAVSPSKTSTTPGDTLSVDVAVKDAKGKPVPNAEVTLWAVDEGSLSITYYHTPQPWRRLFLPREGEILTADTREQLVRTWTGDHRTRPPVVRMGATSIGARRGDFRQTVAFFPNLLTNEKGRVRQTLTLPDGLTEYRVMAVAFTEGAESGSGEEHVRTWKKLMARPTLPRVIRVGDELSANVALSTLDAPKGTASVRMRADGLTLLGPAQRQTPLDPDNPAEVRFALRAETLGTATLSVDATLKPENHARDETDAVMLSTRILPSRALSTVSITGETSAAVAEQLVDLTAVDPNAGGLRLSLSTTPLAGLATGMQDLVEYPYGCTEQTTSRLVPLLELRDLAPSLGVSLTPKRSPYAIEETPDAAAARAVRTLLGHQHKDGSFGLWPESAEPNPTLTAYALWGLTQARKHRLDLPAEAIEQAIRVVQANLSALRADAKPEALEDAAFGLFVLSELGKSDAAAMQTLLQEQRRLTNFSRALLLHTLAREGKASAFASLQQSLEAALVVEGASAKVRESAHDPIRLSSEIRTTAAALRALLAVDPSHAMVEKLALGLLQARRDGRFPTTHDAAWALLALNDLRKARPLPTAPLEAKIFLNNQYIQTAKLGGDRLQTEVFLPMATLQKSAHPTLILATNTGRLFYELSLAFTPKNASLAPVDQGFFVTKRIRSLADLGGPIGETAKTAIAPGDSVLCEIEVVTTSAHSWVVLADPLPGGLAPLQTASRRGPSWLGALEKSPATRKEVREDQVLYFIDHLPAGVHHFQYVAKATHAGTFTTPPTRIEEMYNPTTYGQTPNPNLQIKTR